MIVRPAPPEHYAWIAKRATIAVGPTFQAIEAVDGDRVLGMVGFDSPTPNALCIHVALESPIAGRRLMRPAFDAAFNFWGRAIIYGQVLSNNPRSLRLVEHLGFREIARLPDAWEPGVDLVYVAMRREECRWLEQERRAA